jgi:hypothetical protein
MTETLAPSRHSQAAPQLDAGPGFDVYDSGIVLSPDQRHLYVGNWDPDRKVVMRYTLAPAARWPAARCSST